MRPRHEGGDLWRSTKTFQPDTLITRHGAPCRSPIGAPPPMDDPSPTAAQIGDSVRAVDVAWASQVM